MMVRSSSACSTYQVASSTVALTLALTLLALAPFAAAIEVHHALAAADFDGHQHSDSDLCQWVQHHTGSSLIADAPVLRTLHAQVQRSQPVSQTLLAFDLPGFSPPRGPPLS